MASIEEAYDTDRDTRHRADRNTRPRDWIGGLIPLLGIFLWTGSYRMELIELNTTVLIGGVFIWTATVLILWALWVPEDWS